MAAVQQNTNQRRALIIGGTCAIGQAIVRAFRKAGHPVSATYHSSEAAALSLVDEDAGVHVQPLDLGADPSELGAFVARDLEAHGGSAPGIVVFCAAGIQPVAVGEIDEAAFERHYHTIVRGPLFLIQALYPRLAPDSRFILFSSALARTSTIFDPRYALYASAKAAAEQLVKYLCKPLALKQTTINAVAPGPIDTAGLRAQARDPRASECGESNEQMLAEAGQRHVSRLASMAPFQRIGTPDEVADPVVFLASKEASWISGAILNVSGGMCVYG